MALPYAVGFLSRAARVALPERYDETLGPLLGQAAIDETLAVNDDALRYSCHLMRAQPSRGLCYWRDYPRLDADGRLPAAALQPHPSKTSRHTAIECLRMGAAMRLLQARREGALEARQAWIDGHRRQKRWRALIERVERGVGTLQPHDGLWPDELAFLSDVMGLKLPGHTPTFYALFGRTFLLNAGHYTIISPFHWLPTHNIYMIAEDSQGEGAWYIWRGDKRVDPRVYSDIDFDGHSRADELIKARAIWRADEVFYTGHTFGSFWTHYT